MCYNAPYGGNFIKSLLRLEEALKNNGIDMIYLLAQDASDKEWVNDLISAGKTVYFLGGPFHKDLALLKEILTRHNIRFIHAHFAGTKHLALLNAGRQLFKRDLFLIEHLHNHDNPGNLLKQLVKRSLTNVDLYIGCGEAVADHYKTAHGISDGKITYVTNAIDFDRLHDASEFDDKSVGIDSQSTKFLIFGFDYFRKGVDISLEAINNLVKKDYNIHLLISLATNKEYVESMISERFGKIPDWIRILDPREDIGSYYRFADCFLSPSRSEGLCYSVIEAAYCGAPIIISDIPGQSTLNIPHLFKFKSEDVAGLQNELMTVMSLTDTEREEITSREKEYVQKTYNLDRWANQILQVYEQFLN